MWNDPAIQAHNPFVSLPAIPIQLILTSKLIGFGLTVVHFLRNADPLLASLIHINMTTQQIDWPLSAYQGRYQFQEAPEAQLTAVINNNGALGYSISTEAQLAGMPSVSYLHSAGTTILPSAQSVSFALMEKGADGWDYSNADSFGVEIILTNTVGAAAWPMSTFLYLYIDSMISLSTCAVVRRIIMNIIHHNILYCTVDLIIISFM